MVRILAIAAGGALGTLARYVVGRAIPAPLTGFPWRTFSVNVVGSLALGVIITLVTERWPPTRYVRPFAAIGFCGGFTTFSTLMVEVDQRFQYGRPELAIVYLLVSLVAGVLAAAVGVNLARLWGDGVRKPGAIPDPDGLASLAATTGPPPSPTPDERTAP
jgi:CrcB protein